MKFRDIGPYRFFFTSNDRDEPPHIHIEREGMVAKFWLKPVRLGKVFEVRSPRAAKDGAHHQGVSF